MDFGIWICGESVGGEVEFWNKIGLDNGLKGIWYRGVLVLGIMGFCEQ